MKKNNIFNKIIAAFLAFLLLFIVSCDNTTPKDTSDSTNVTWDNTKSNGNMMYKFEYLSPNEDGITRINSHIANFSSVTWDRKIIIQDHGKYIYDPETDSYNKLTLYWEDDTYRYNSGLRLIPLSDGGYITSGGAYELELFNNLENTQSEDKYIYPHHQITLRIDSEGNLAALYPYPEELPEFDGANNQYIADVNGYLYVYISRGSQILVFSPEAEYLFSLDSLDGMNDQKLLLNNDGEVVYCNSKRINILEDLFTFRTIDIKNQCWSDEKDCKTAPVELTKVQGESVKKVMFGEGFDIYYVDSYGIIGRNDGEKHLNYLFEWLDVGLSYSEIVKISICSSELVFVILADPDGSFRYGKIEYMPVSSVYGESVDTPMILKVAADQENSHYFTDLLKYCASFVRSDGGCQVEIISYSDSGGLTANQQLIRDISAGKVPDIVIFGGGLTYENLVKTDIFADLYGLIDDDPEMSRDDFISCVRKPFETPEGELKQLALSFGLCTMAGKESVFSGMDFTVAELRKFNASLDSDRYLISARTSGGKSEAPGDMLSSLLPYMLGDYIDYDTGTYNLDGLRELLLLCSEAKIYNSPFFIDPELTQSGTVLLHPALTFDVAMFLVERYMNFTGDMVYTGYPGGDGGSCVSPLNTVAITKKSENSEMAWKLIRYFIDSHVDELLGIKPVNFVMDSYGFPCTRDGIETLLSITAQLEFRLSGGYVKNSNGSESYNLSMNAVAISEENETTKRDGIYSIVYSDEDFDALMNLFETADYAYVNDTATISIIEEEASAYFSGAKSLDETMKIIQNRVSIYLDE